ncbi:cadherin domain-containing protein [Chitinophaga sp. Hz27]|uniref:cadherin domain-containing protein n=1 Tax=Chitinophaga sp. Hz27 TaxID=3347169 RepID=UPI0035DFCCA8
MQLHIIAGLIILLSGMSNMVMANAKTSSHRSETVAEVPPAATVTSEFTSVNTIFTVNITFSKVVSLLSISNISFSNGALANLIQTSDSSYRITVAPLISGTPVTISVPANVVTDTIGNGNTASNTLSVAYDVTRPAALLQTAKSNVNGSFVVKLHLDRTSADLFQSKITVVNGTINSLGDDPASANPNDFIFNIVPTAEGPVQVFIPDNTLHDVFTNTFLFSNRLEVLYDVTKPTAVITSPKLRINSPTTLTVYFSEPVTDFSLADIVASNGTVSNLAGAFPGKTYSFLANPLANPVTISIPGGQVTDLAGNPNLLTTVLTLSYDNIAPVILANQQFNIPEFSAVGTSVAMVNANDASGILNNWIISTNSDQNSNGIPDFKINATTGQITVNDNALSTVFGTTCYIRVTVTDDLNTSAPQDVAIHLLSTNTAPSDINLSFSSVGENNTIGNTIGSFSATDPDINDIFTYTLVAGIGSIDNNAFVINGNQLQSAISFDYETKSQYSIRVRVTDSKGATFEKIFTISVIDKMEPPTALTLSNNSIAENKPTGTVIGSFSATDPDAGSSFTYTLVAGNGSNDNNAFTISGNNLQAAASFDFETKSQYTIRVRVTDNGGLSLENIFIINVTDINEAPTNLTISNNSIPENQPAGVVLGSFSTADPDAGSSFTYALVAGNGSDDNNAFTISGNNLQAATSFDFETKSQYTIRVRVTDNGGLSLENVFIINVTDVNEAPTNLTISNNSIPENQPAGTVIGSFSTTDPDANSSFTYSLVTGTGSDDNSTFTIIGNQLQAAASFDFETKSQYTVRIRVTDNGGLSLENVFIINVTDVNEAPTNLTISNNSIPENQPAGKVIGSFSATDPDAGSSFTYALVAGNGSDDNAQFMISGYQLKSAASYNYENKSQYKVRVRVTDNNGLTFELPFLITIIDVNEIPGINPVADQSFCYDPATQQIMLTGISAGEDKNQTVQLSVTADQPYFNVLSIKDNGNGTAALLLTMKPQVTGTALLTVKIKDNGGTANGGIDEVSTTFALRINALPAVAITSSQGLTVDKGTQLQLTATGGVVYEWSNTIGMINGQHTPVLSIIADANNTYQVTVTDNNGCESTGALTLTVNQAFKMDATNILTPNGDGINDFFRIRNIAAYTNNELKVFDRAGRIVYSRKNYDNQWDGKVNGSLLAEGTYYYIFEVVSEGKPQLYKGYISIIQNR